MMSDHENNILHGLSIWEQNLPMVIIVSITVALCSSLFVLFLCMLCPRKSVDLDCDTNNVQVIYNPHAAASVNLPTCDMYGAFRNAGSKERLSEHEKTGRMSTDTVICNPAVMELGVDNDAYSHSFESNNNSMSERSMTFHNITVTQK